MADDPDSDRAQFAEIVELAWPVDVAGHDESSTDCVSGSDTGLDLAWLKAELEAGAAIDEPVTPGWVGVQVGELVGMDRGEDVLWRVAGQDAADEGIGGFDSVIQREACQPIGVGLGA